MTPRRILVIRRDNVGDLVCTTPAIALLRRSFPRARIAALVNSYNADVLDGSPDVDHVYVYTKLKHRAGRQSLPGALLARARMLMQIRAERFDVAVLCKASWDRHGLRFARHCGVARTIGFASPEAGAQQPDIALPSPDPLIHEVEAVAKLLSPFGIVDQPGPLRVFPDARAAEMAEQRLAALGTRPRLALHLSARALSRRWPEENWIETARLAAEAGWGIVLLWSPGAADNAFHPGDDALAASIAAALQSVPRVAFSTSGLRELVAGLSRCQAFVGADGGAMHLAAAAGLPSVALFENSPLKTRHWYPWKTPHEVVCGPDLKVWGITPRQVMDALTRLAGARAE